MTNIPINFENKCVCGAIETMSHIYSCEIIFDYNRIHNGNLKKYKINTDKNESKLGNKNKNKIKK